MARHGLRWASDVRICGVIDATKPKGANMLGSTGAHRHLTRCHPKPPLEAPLRHWRASMAGARVPGATAQPPLPPMAEAQGPPPVRVHGLWAALHAAVAVLVGSAQATWARLGQWARQLLALVGLGTPKADPPAAPADDGKLFRTQNGTLLSPYLHDDKILRANRQAYANGLAAGKAVPRIEELRALAALFGVQLRILQDVEHPDDAQGLAFRERERSKLPGPCRGFVDLFCPSELPWQVLFDGPLNATEFAQAGRGGPGVLGDKAALEAHGELMRVLHKMPVVPAHDDKDGARVRLMSADDVVPSGQSSLRRVSFTDAFYCAIADASGWPYCRAVLDGVLRGTSISALRDDPELMGAFAVHQDDGVSKSALKRQLVAQLVLKMRAEVGRRLLDERHTAALDSMMQFALAHGRPVDAL
jgi:hypothetical protein